MVTGNSYPFLLQICQPKQITLSRFACLIATGLLALGACTHTSTGSIDPPHCSNTVQAKVSASKPAITVTYTEPSMNQAGNPLKELAKTSVYYDLGAGRVLAKEIPSTKPSGGGQVSETITLPVKNQKETIVHICVTATDRQGHESAATP